MAKDPAASASAPVRSPCLPRCNTALVLVDFINPLDFPGARRLQPYALAAAHATWQLRQRLARRGVPVIYANDNYGHWQSNFCDLLVRCQALPGQRGEMARLLAPAPHDLTVLKPRHSAFFATPLDLLLRDMGVQNLVLTGLATDMCVHFTAVDAFMHGYRLWVPGDCVAAETPAAQQAALQHMERTLRCCTRSARGRAPFHTIAGQRHHGYTSAAR